MERNLQRYVVSTELIARFVDAYNEHFAVAQFAAPYRKLIIPSTEEFPTRWWVAPVSARQERIIQSLPRPERLTYIQSIEGCLPFSEF